MEYPNFEHIHNEFIFYCSICHKIFKFETSFEAYTHLNETKSKFTDNCVMSFKEEEIEKAFNEVIAWKEEYSNIEKINYSKESGVIIYVYDIGNFIFEKISLIKDKPISILQIPLFPIEPKQEIIEKLENLSFDILYPSIFCQTSYPCQHQVYLHLKDDNLRTWYKYRSMRGNEIWKYQNYLPRPLRVHFSVYGTPTPY